MNILLFSNGRMGENSATLEYGYDALREQIKTLNIKKYLFIPYAIIGDDSKNISRIKQVQDSLSSLGVEVESILDYDNPVEAVNQCQALLVSGGNTWYLNRTLHDKGLITPIRKAVLHRNVSYVGWSAGSNVACPTILTTNDMPIISSVIIPSLALLPIQINPHYTDTHPSGHMGETRDVRINEVLYKNRDIYILGLREGSYLWYKENKLTYHAPHKKSLKVFKYDQETKELYEKDDLQFLLS